ncbi:glycosyltransferase family 39 protein [Candidatus Woesearchaeota archaeon]|nr:glycosyltransferase family 39 protein [Candidatus Woesearchaeota archaeon]
MVKKKEKFEGELKEETVKVEVSAEGSSNKSVITVQNNNDNSNSNENSNNMGSSENINRLNNLENKLTFSDKLKLKTIEFLKDKYNLMFLVVFIIGLVIRLKYLNLEVIWNDAAVHMWYVIKIINDPTFVFSFNFIYGDHLISHFVTIPFYLITKNIVASGRLASILIGMVGVILIYLLGKEISNKNTGLIAAAILSFHPLFWFLNVWILADAHMATAVIFSLYCFVRMNKEKTTFWGIMTGISFVLTMLAKFQAAHFFMILIIYYILFDIKRMFKTPWIYSWVIPSLSIFADLFMIIIGKKSTFVLRALSLMIDFRGMPFGLDTTKLFPWTFTWSLLLLSLFGAILIIIYRKKEFYFPIFFFLFYWTFSEVNLDQPDARHLLFLVPIIILIASFFIDEVRNFLNILSKKKIISYFSYILMVLLVIIICYNFYQTGTQFIQSKSLTYTGYQEAGQWIKENVPEDIPIFAGEYRSIRLFTEREFGGPTPEFYGGPILNLRSPRRYTEEHESDGKSNFELDVANLSKNSDVYLEIDIWEYAQPKWYWPLSENSLKYFESLGFKLVNMIERDVMTSDGLKKIPVIFILRKDKEVINATKLIK